METDRFGMTILDTNTCWDLLRQTEVGRLAVSIADHPDIFPINFVVDNGTVVFRTAEGTKLAAGVLGRSVAFEIDGYDPAAGDAWSVVIKGRAREIERMQDVFDALDLPLFPWHASPKHRFVRIAPDDVSGRRFHVVMRAPGTSPDAPTEHLRNDVMSEEPRPAELFQLDRTTCLALLATQPVGRLVNGATDSPVVVVNYVVRDDAIVFRSDAGARVAAILGSTVAFEADMYDERTRSGWSVVARGTARDVTCSEGAEPQPEVDTWAPGPKSRWLRITVDEITGRLLRGEVPASWVNSGAYL